MELDFGFNLGGCTVLPRQGTITVKGNTVHLEPKVMGVLLALARRDGDVVRREEFLDEVWPGVVVGDEVLNRSISILRSHLEDDTSNPHYIQTVPKVGYRLVVQVTPHEEEARSGRPWPTRSLWFLATAAIAAIILSGLYIWFWPRASDTAAWQPKGDSVSMAVIRFADRGEAAREIGAGLLDELMSDLGRVPRLRVMMRPDRADVDPCERARSTDAETLLTGSVQADGERIRVSYQWFAADDCQLILSNTHEARIGDIFELQTAMSRAIVGRLALALDTQLDTGPKLAPPSTPALYSQVLLGRSYLDIGRNDLQRRGVEPIRRSIRIFEQALEEDPNLVMAHLRLAQAYAVLPSYLRAEHDTLFARALAELDQVAKLDGSAVRTYATRAYLHAEAMEFGEAMEMFQLAIAYTPSDAYVRQWYSAFLSTVGYLERSLDEAAIAVDLDPTSPVNIHRLAIADLWVDQNAEAERNFALAHSVGVEAFVNPEPYLILLLRLQRYEELEAWMETIQRTMEYPRDSVRDLVEAVRDPRPEAVSQALQTLQRARAEGQISARLYWGFLILLRQGDPAIDATLRMIENREAANELQFLFVSEAAYLRVLPRFAEIVRSAGLDRFWDKYGWPAACARVDGEIRCR